MTPKYPKEWLEKVPAEVFGCLRPGELRILVRPKGVLSAVESKEVLWGVPLDFPAELIPTELRMPNTRLWLDLSEDTKIIRAWRREE
jgi:hypothetical protein